MNRLKNFNKQRYLYTKDEIKYPNGGNVFFNLNETYKDGFRWKPQARKFLEDMPNCSHYLVRDPRLYDSYSAKFTKIAYRLPTYIPGDPILINYSGDSMAFETPFTTHNSNTYLTNNNSKKFSIIENAPNFISVIKDNLKSLIKSIKVCY